MKARKAPIPRFSSFDANCKNHTVEQWSKTRDAGNYTFPEFLKITNLALDKNANLTGNPQGALRSLASHKFSRFMIDYFYLLQHRRSTPPKKAQRFPCITNHT